MRGLLLHNGLVYLALVPTRVLRTCVGSYASYIADGKMLKPFIIVNVWLLTFEPILLLQVHEFVCPTLLPKVRKFGLGIFYQDSAESLNHLLKSIFLTMTNRGGSTQVDTTFPPGVADRFHRESLAMKQTLQYIFL